MAHRAAKENTSSYPIATLSKRLLQLFRERLDDALRPYGVTAAQLHVLTALEREPGISGARLARACTVTPQTTQVLIRGIEANQWISRAKHPENERILLATLTPAGKRVLSRSRRSVSKTYQQMLLGFADKDVVRLTNLLLRCTKNLEINGAQRVLQGTGASKAGARPEAAAHEHHCTQ